MKKLPWESIDHGFIGNILQDPMAFLETKDGKSGEDFPLNKTNPFRGKHGGSPKWCFFGGYTLVYTPLSDQAMFVGKIVLNFPADMASDGSDPLMRRTS